MTSMKFKLAFLMSLGFLPSNLFPLYSLLSLRYIVRPERARERSLKVP